MTLLKHDKLRVAGIEPESVVDGDGIRMTIFFQGCSHHCPGCQNPSTWDPNKPVKEMTPEEIVEEYKKNPLLNGITLSGGEPYEQDVFVVDQLCKKIHELGGDVWCYTGYDIEEIKWTLEDVDYIVDGPFVQEERDLSLAFRGSRNQRIWKIDKYGIFHDMSREFDNR